LPLPTLEGLAAYIQGPLAEDEKIPLSDHEMQALSAIGEPRATCTQSDVRHLFRSSEDEQARFLWSIADHVITFSPPASDGTESSFHGFWDNNMRTLLDAAIVCKSIRDSNDQTSTNLMRPDFGVLVNGFCAFRGEEKAPGYSGKHPKAELIEKLTWTYDPAPYVLGGCGVSNASAVADFHLLRLSRNRTPCYTRSNFAILS
jgi:hypothetical protein